MKKHLFLVLVVMLSMFIALNAYGYTPGNGITGTPHDLSKKNNSTYGGATEQSGLDRICVYCHAPHHTIKPSDAATLGYNYVPLWNHDLTTQTFTMYANGTDVPGDPTRQAPNTNGANNPNSNVVTTSMNSPTLLCLSCHDGTVATDAYGTQAVRAAQATAPTTGRLPIAQARSSFRMAHIRSVQAATLPIIIL